MDIAAEAAMGNRPVRAADLGWPMAPDLDARPMDAAEIGRWRVVENFGGRAR
jgi:hypothetical protein